MAAMEKATAAYDVLRACLFMTTFIVKPFRLNEMHDERSKVISITVYHYYNSKGMCMR